MPPPQRTNPKRLFAVLGPLVVFYLIANIEHKSSPPCHTVRSPTLHVTGVQAAAEIPPPPVRAPPLKEEKKIDTTARPVVGVLSQPSVAGPGRRMRDLPHCAYEGRAKSFLFVFMGHSGSSAILSELQGHSETLIEDREPVDHYEYEFNTTLALQYTRQFFRRGIQMGKVAGFKMRPIHINKDPTAWAELAREFGTRIIWQYRENLVKQAVGEYSYKYLNDSSVIEGLRSKEAIGKRCDTGVGCSFEIKDFEFFHRTLKDCLHSDKAIAKGVHVLAGGGDCVHAMPYEDYLYDRRGSMMRLFKFLGLKQEDTEPERYKATKDNLCHVVSNWEELCRNFYGCHVWRHMFDDERNDCYCRFSSGHVDYCDTVYTGRPT